MTQNNVNSDNQSSNKKTISQAMILAAGKGTRLRPLTLETPKPLVKVGGQPLIMWHIKALAAAGITDIVINTSWLSDKLMTAIGNGDDYGVKIHWSIEEDEPLETAGGIAQALREGHLKNEPFILINGDIWTDFDLTPLTQYKMSANQQAYLLLTKNPEHNLKGDFAVANGLASERPIDGREKYTFAGISVIAPSLVAGIAAGQSAPLAPLLKKAMLKFEVSAEVMDAKWVDVGTPTRLNEINHYLDSQT